MSLSIQRRTTPHGIIDSIRMEKALDRKSIDGVEERLVTLVKQTLGATAALPLPFPADMQLSDLGISSLKMVNLMLAVELEFDIAIPQSDITPENFHSVAAIQVLVVRTLSQRR